jgi:PPM family protein phosphatase
MSGAARCLATGRLPETNVPDFRYEMCAQTDTGRARENNEDSVRFDAPTGVAVLADGMGGYNAGEVASSMATDLICTEMTRWLQQAGGMASGRDVRRALELCVDNANRAVFSAANQNRKYAGMGTTLVTGVFLGNRLTLGHIGDSRAYRMRGQALQQITRDHSLLQEQIDAGMITPAQAARSVHKNLVTRALGVEERTLLDLAEHVVEPDDLYLMCSDGLSDMLEHDQIEALLNAAPNLDEKARVLVDAANTRGGRDNISVLLVHAATPERRSGTLISRWLRT